MGELVNKAIIFATEKHGCLKTRKLDKIPYIIHPLEVSSIIASMTNNENTIAAGLLHDVIEDTGTTKEEVRDAFGDDVLKLVLSETENKYRSEPSKSTWKRRKQESLDILKNTDDINVKILWVGDKLSNLRSVYRAYKKIGNKLFDSFNNSNPDDHKWYYKTILEYTKELENEDAWKELKRLYCIVFGEDK